MPYRRLPNTDISRLKAINKAIEISRKVSDSELAFSFAILQKLKFFQPKFELALNNLKDAKQKQINGNKNYMEKLRKAHLYTSHFIQTVNLCITRGELKESDREFYGINNNDKTIPDLSHESYILEWGQKIINGEKERIHNGGNPIYTPSIANVNTNYSIFKTEYYMQKQLQKNTQRFSEEVANKRKEADNLIQRLWNEIEEYHQHESSDERKRELCSEYGIKYILRRKERQLLLQKKLL